MAAELIRYECFGCGCFIIRPRADADDAPCPICEGTDRGWVSPFAEEEWKACAEPHEIRQTLCVMNQPISTRKARLVRCEICRRLYGSHFDAPLWDVLEIATQYADRLVTESVREQAEKHLRHEIPERYGFAPVWWQYALACIEEDEDSDWPGDYGSEHRGLPRDESVPLVAAHCYHEIFGNPFRPVAFSPEWRTSDVMLLANGIYTDRAFDRMPVLADALQEAGCDSDDLLNHLRDPHAVHVRGCWALDLVLGKE